jgi:hypothetical protein
MNAKSAKVRVGTVREIEAELAKGSKLISLKQLTPSRFEVIYTCVRLGLCRAIIALRPRSKKSAK